MKLPSPAQVENGTVMPIDVVVRTMEDANPRAKNRGVTRRNNLLRPSPNTDWQNHRNLQRLLPPAFIHPSAQVPACIFSLSPLHGHQGNMLPPET